MKGPLISVVVPCYRPDEGLVTSVASIVNQTYASLEILIVDDASGPGYDTVFQRAVALDERITLIRLPDNAGPYLARNQAMSCARGALITFQDSDDWSHPARLGEQVALLARSPGAPACHTRAVRAHDDLSHQWLGYPATRLHASSLMIRRSVYEQLGDFLPVRKGGDSEYAERIEAEIGPIPTVEKPLAVYRLRSGSLSRADFTYQWTSPDRLAFLGVYRARLRAGRPVRLPAPLRYITGEMSEAGVTDRLDVAYVGDFSPDPESDPALQATIDLVAPPPLNPGELSEGLRGRPRAGLRRGLWHLEAPWSPSRKRRMMHPGWFDRVLAEPGWQVVTRVEPVRIGLLVVLDPSVLLLCDQMECAPTVGRVQVTRPPVDSFDCDIAPPTVDQDEVQTVVRKWFDVDPEWV
ncbi:MAG: glycosyltransferase family A protein [Ornithinimicrobium sp.]